MSSPEQAERRGRVDTTLEKHDETLDDHEERLTNLERFRWLVLGGLLVLSVMIGSAKLVSVLTFL